MCKTCPYHYVRYGDTINTDFHPIKQALPQVCHENINIKCKGHVDYYKEHPEQTQIVAQTEYGCLQLRISIV